MPRGAGRRDLRWSIFHQRLALFLSQSILLGLAFRGSWVTSLLQVLSNGSIVPPSGAQVQAVTALGREQCPLWVRSRQFALGMSAKGQKRTLSRFIRSPRRREQTATAAR